MLCPNTKKSLSVIPLCCIPIFKTKTACTKEKRNIGLQFLASGLSISHEIRRISCEIHPKPYKSKCFSKNSSVWWMQGGGYDPGFHEILGHSPSPAPPKTKEFLLKHLIYKVFHVKSARFHVKSAWNPPDFKIMSFCVMIKYRSVVFRKTKQQCNEMCLKYWQCIDLCKAAILLQLQQSLGQHLTVDFAFARISLGLHLCK